MGNDRKKKGENTDSDYGRFVLSPQSLQGFVKNILTAAITAKQRLIHFQNAFDDFISVSILLGYDALELNI